MAAQVEQGHDVAYFFSGRHYPRVRGPRFKRGRRRGVVMHEVLNGPMISGLELGTSTPQLEIDEPRLEAAFGRLLGSFRPDVVHFQELLCLPSALIDVAGRAGVPTVMTLQDYFPLCPTLRLWDADGRLCTRLRVGEECAVRNAAAPTTPAPFVIDTLVFEIARWRARLRIGEGVSWVLFDRVADAAFDLATRGEPPLEKPAAEAPDR